MYEAIARNRRNTVLLAAGMTVLLLALGYLVGTLWGQGLLGVVGGLVVAGLLATVSYYGGSGIVLTAVGAREVQKADDPQLFNVVEEVAIAAGLPMPKVYLIDDPSPNAFATGRDPQHAAVAITRGLREKLTRDELQGVVAHEIAHIQNRDILFMTVLVVMVGAVVLLADVYWRAARYGRLERSDQRAGRNGRSSRRQALWLVVGLLLASVAPLLARLIQAAASREREYLADASAALLTRYPEGLASALEKIAKDPGELKAAGRATQALFIVNPFDKESPRNSLFDSHPPLAERIRRLRSMR